MCEKEKWFCTFISVLPNVSKAFPGIMDTVEIDEMNWSRESDDGDT